MTKAEQALVALEDADGTRMEQASYRRRLRSGELSVAEVLLDPPYVLRNMPVVNVLQMARSYRRGGVWLERLGREAARDNVNLCVALGKASERTRYWTAQRADRGRHLTRLAA